MSCEDWYAQGKKVNIDGRQIFYAEGGQGETLVCIHGFPTSSWDFEAMWPALTGRFHVISNDLIGLGRSAKPKSPINVGMQADIIESLAIKLDIKEAHILAHDLGDTVAQELLARQANGKAKLHWKSCVFLNGGIFSETYRPLFIQKLLTSPVGQYVAKLMSEKTFKRSMTKIFGTKNPPTEDFIKNSWKLLRENQGLSMIPRLLKYMRERQTNRTRWVTPLENNIVPMRLINGPLDPISGRHIAIRFREVVPQADVVLLEDLGHYPHVEDPKLVLDAFLEFHDKLN